jgi:(2R)-sulfolactate sulfo-lyase subunit alpha/altronate dehydratase small subunit
MDVKAIMLDEKDNVATCMHGAHKGDLVQCIGGTNVQVVCIHDILDCHKIALQAIVKDGYVYKYGEIIGAAEVDIPAGDWVSHENIRSLPRDYDSEIL